MIMMLQRNDFLSLDQVKNPKLYEINTITLSNN